MIDFLVRQHRFKTDRRQDMIPQIVDQFERSKCIEPGVHLPVKLREVGTLFESMLQRPCRAGNIEPIDQCLQFQWRTLREIFILVRNGLPRQNGADIGGARLPERRQAAKPVAKQSKNGRVIE